MEFKELTVEELAQGFVHTEKEKKLVCIFCGETFDKDVIYQSGGRMLTAQGAMKEHLSHIHGGVFTDWPDWINRLTDSPIHRRNFLKECTLERITRNWLNRCR